MLDPANVPAVSNDELLTRFIVVSSHFRRANNTVKPDAFIPHPRCELSLTRLLEATSDEIWTEGEREATIRSKTLYGRADVTVEAFQVVELCVIARPVQDNPNHADAINWPAEKSAQKMKALEIAARSTYLQKTKQS